MAHFADQYADRFNELLHSGLFAHYFYKQEIIEIPGLLTAILVTYDGVPDDRREIHDSMSWEGFLTRMSVVKGDWIHFEHRHMEGLRDQPQKTMGGWEGRTIYFIKGGQHADQWTPDKADVDVKSLLGSALGVWGKMIQTEVEALSTTVPVGIEHFREYEHRVRVIFNFLFVEKLGEGRWQSRTEPEDEGVEIRDLLFGNKSDSGFWKDLKDKYLASEIVVDAKNKSVLTRVVS